MPKEIKFLLIGQSIPLTLGVFEQVLREHQISAVIEFTTKEITPVKSKLFDFAKSAGAEYKLVHKNDEQENLRGFYKIINPDIVVICSMPALLKEDLLLLPNIGTINVHPSYLPFYKGPNPKFWIYYYGEKYGGVSIHYVDKGEDTGNILSQQQFDIPLGLSSGSYDKLIIDSACKIINEGIDKAIKRDIGIVQRKETGSRRARRIKKDDTFNESTSWEIERLFHFINGTGHVPANMTFPFLIRKLFNATIKSYKKVAISSGKVGKFSFDSRGFYYNHKEGKIYFKLKPKGY